MEEWNLLSISAIDAFTVEVWWAFSEFELRDVIETTEQEYEQIEHDLFVTGERAIVDLRVRVSYGDNVLALEESKGHLTDGPVELLEDEELISEFIDFALDGAIESAELLSNGRSVTN